MNLNFDHLYQQIIDTEQQLQNKVARIAEGYTNLCCLFTH